METLSTKEIATIKGGVTGQSTNSGIETILVDSYPSVRSGQINKIWFISYNNSEIKSGSIVSSEPITSTSVSSTEMKSGS